MVEKKSGAAKPADLNSECERMAQLARDEAMTPPCYTRAMGFTPPPEKLATFNASALLTTAFLGAVRTGTFTEGLIVCADGVRRWPSIDPDGRWTLVAASGSLFTSATFRMLCGGVLQGDGSISLDGRAWWLCSVLLSDGALLAFAVPA